MKQVVLKAFGGLNMAYMGRQWFFGALVAATLMLAFSLDGRPLDFNVFVFCGVNLLLYPYARFAYEKVSSFIIGENFFLVSAGALLFVKAITITLCFLLAVFIAPFGLLYLAMRRVDSVQQPQQ